MAARTAHLRLSLDSDHLAHRLADLLKTLSRMVDQALIHPYHPERHYMRGPGPRWHAKHGRRQTPAAKG